MIFKCSKCKSELILNHRKGEKDYRENFDNRNIIAYYIDPCSYCLKKGKEK